MIHIEKYFSVQRDCGSSRDVVGYAISLRDGLVQLIQCSEEIDGILRRHLKSPDLPDGTSAPNPTEL